ncbi:Hypothetical predicted protein [Pelobates cultripes]|uniref:Uncharacterized protein n=1 Tax=Pelobates cultripes TaxID=61616 RepID=A0AAD1WJP3_PELCU|nr:Hypothetical predicted protein [Pelobates cultripes]
MWLKSFYVAWRTAARYINGSHGGEGDAVALCSICAFGFCNRQSDSDFSGSLTHSSQKQVIGIFSRCSETYYKWLIDKLKGREFVKIVENVLSVHITNTSSEFPKMLYKCTFAILYHSYKWGRINISDVTDSLYDRQLHDLSWYLGQEKIMVILDDMDLVNNDERQRILSTQPSIQSLSSNLLLIPANGNKQTAQKKLEEFFMLLEGVMGLIEVYGTLHSLSALKVAYYCKLV